MFDGSFALLKRVFRYLPFSAGESTDARLNIQLGGGAATLAALIPTKAAAQAMTASNAVVAFNQLVRASAESISAGEAVTATEIAAIEVATRPSAYRPLASQMAYQARMNTPVGRKPFTSTATANRPIAMAELKKVPKTTKSQSIRGKTKVFSQSASIYALPSASQSKDAIRNQGLRLVA